MFIKVAVREIDPPALAWLRLALAAIVLVPAALVVTGRRADLLGWLAGRRDGSALTVHGGTLPSLPPL
jgi:hypothetical protein